MTFDSSQYPEHVRASIEANRAAYAAAAAPLLADLRSVGFDVTSVGELVQKGLPYEPAIPVLIRWLPTIEYEPLREDIIRGLSVPFARPAATRALVDEFKRLPPASNIQWAAGNGLEVVGDDSVYADLVEIVKHAAYGRARQMVVLALGKVKHNDPTDVLIPLLDDDDVRGHAVMALGKLRAVRARPHLERRLDDRMAWVRKEAAKALRRIDERA